MNSSAWGANLPAVHSHSLSPAIGRRRAPRVEHALAVRAVLAPVEPSSRPSVLPKSHPDGDAAAQQRGGVQRLAHTGRALAGQLLGLFPRDGGAGPPQHTFQDAEKLRELGGKATERGLQVRPRKKPGMTCRDATLCCVAQLMASSEATASCIFMLSIPVLLK